MPAKRSTDLSGCLLSGVVASACVCTNLNRPLTLSTIPYRKIGSAPRNVIRHLPNSITILRLIVSPVLAALLCCHRFSAALGLVVFAGATDWLDGYAARKLHVSGKTGVLLDPLADKALLVTLFLALGYIRLIPLWLLCLVIGRDLVIVIGSILLRIFRNVQHFVPSIVGKVSTFFQMVFVLLVLLSAAFPHRIFVWLETTALVLTAIFTAVSGVGYVRKGIQLTRRRDISSTLSPEQSSNR